MVIKRRQDGRIGFDIACKNRHRRRPVCSSFLLAEKQDGEGLVSSRHIGRVKIRD
jgi:hypothetical protein